MAGSCLVKLPQIVKIVNSGSAQGLNPMSFEVETFCAMVAATYGFVHQLSFSSFGESVVRLHEFPFAPVLYIFSIHLYMYIQAIGIQNVVLLGMIYRYQKRSFVRKALVMSVLCLWIAAAQGGFLTRDVLTMLFDVNSIVLLVSRIPQILQNYSSKSTGQLSFTTYAMNFMGTLARVFTTLQEKNAGSAMLRGVIMCTLLFFVILIFCIITFNEFFYMFAAMVMNGILVSQIIIYGSSPHHTSVERDMNKKKQ